MFLLKGFFNWVGITFWLKWLAAKFDLDLERLVRRPFWLICHARRSRYRVTASWQRLLCQVHTGALCKIRHTTMNQSFQLWI